MNSNFQTNDSPLSARGRFGRLSYLGWNMLLVFLLILLGILAGIFLPVLMNLSPESMTITTSIYFLIIYIVVIFFSFIFAIRRLHDKNQSGWLSLIMLVPLINLFFFVYLSCAKGDEGTNGYGAPRVTKGWEKVLGWIYIILIPIGTILIAVSAIPAYQSYIERAQLQQLEYQQQIEQSE